MRPKKILIDGNTLSIDDVYSLVSDPHVVINITDSSFSLIQKSKQFLDRELDKKVIYGVNTGFGPMASHIISKKQVKDLQENLILSHACGMGEPLCDEYVLAAMLVRLNTLVKGFSGVSLELVERLQYFINKRIIPIVPEHGAVGTSGDLTHLAHIALAILGKGEVTYKGKRAQAQAILKRFHITPYKLEAKEGLALINGTSMMAAISSLVCFHAARILSIATRLGAFGLELVRGFDDSISERLHGLRPHCGQVKVAYAIRDILKPSRLLQSREAFQNSVKLPERVRKIPETVQEVYSFRCIPQILGPILDTLTKTRREVEIEMNSVTDNPIVDWEYNMFLHGGNFHGDYIAAGVDQLKMSLVKLILLSERRTNFFLNSNVNTYLPPFLNLKKPGLTLALQGLQFVATSTAAQSQTLAFPHSIHSISTNADNQDVVSMGSDACLFAAKVVENAYVLLAIELITLAQAVDVLKIRADLSNSSRKLFDAIRKLFPVIKNDRVLVHELPGIIHFLKRHPSLAIPWDTLSG